MADNISGQLGSAPFGAFGLGWAGPLTVQQVRINSFTIDVSEPVVPERPLVLSLATTFATGATITPDIGTVPVNGTIEINAPDATTTYTVTVTDGVNPPQSRSITVTVEDVAIFVRAVDAAAYGFDVSVQTQLDMGNLVVVGLVGHAFSGATNDLTVEDDLGNTYEIAVQNDAAYPPDPVAHADYSLMAYTYVEYPGTATITGRTASRPDAVVLVIGVSQYQRPPGFELTQVAHDIGGEEAAPNHAARGTAPVNYANSLLITWVRDGGYRPSDIISLDGDTRRCMAGLDVGFGRGSHAAALFDAILTGPGIRNSNADITPFDGMRILVAVWSKPLPRPDELDSQAAVRPGLSSAVSYSGQPSVKVSLPYMPKIGSLVLVGVMENYGFPSTIPTYAVEDDYGNTYTPYAPAALNMNGSVTHQLFRTIVTNLPSSGVFSATVSMDIFTRSKLAVIAEYYFPPTPDFQLLEKSGQTSLGGGLLKLFTEPASVIGRNLIAGFALNSNGTSNPTTWESSDGFIIDAHWHIGQVTPSPLSTIPVMIPGAWFHKYVTNETLDCEIATSDYSSYDNDILAIGFPVGGTLSLYCASSRSCRPSGGGVASLYA